MHPRLDEVGLHQQLLVVHALQFAEKLIQQRYRILVFSLLKQLSEARETREKKSFGC